MKKKGVTPVVASILLMTVTIAAAGTLYTVVQGDLQNSNTDTKIPLNLDSLSVEKCYKESGDTFLVVRNGATEAINASEITPLLNGTIADSYTINKEIVGPQSSFSIEITGGLSSDTDIQLTDGENSAHYNC